MAQDHQHDTHSSLRHPRNGGAPPSARRGAADPRDWTTTWRGGGGIVGQVETTGSTDDPFAHAARGDNGALAAPRPAQRVALIVDREPIVRSLLRAVLARQGWHVIDASGPAESFAKLDRHRPGLLVIDPTPREPDVDLVARIRSRDPRASIVVVSDDPIAAGIARQLGARFIPKPFAIQDFAMYIGSASDTDSQPAHFTGSASQRQPEATSAGGRTFRTTGEALDAWRAAERRLEGAMEDGPLRSQLESEVIHCRDAYLRLVDMKTRLRDA